MWDLCTDSYFLLVNKWKENIVTFLSSAFASKFVSILFILVHFCGFSQQSINVLILLKLLKLFLCSHSISYQERWISLVFGIGRVLHC